eukprot:g19943.t1
MLGAFNRSLFATAVLLCLVVPVPQVRAEPVARNSPAAGAVIARKTGEEVRFIDVSAWQFVDLKQDLVSGDILRTNATGQLAILFSDRTQIRMGRNATLVVKQVTSSTSADTVLELQSGTIWARAERGGPGVQVETPAAAAAIRGTDWTMTVDGAKTSLNVLDGLVQLQNAQGSVEVRQGEGAIASIGQAPRKIVIVESDDREQMLFYLPPREAFSRMPASTEPVAVMRREADRIATIPADRRTTSDWIDLAEAQLTLEGRQKARSSLAAIQGQSLSAAQRARVTLIEAILLATDKRYGEAAKLFERAQMGLDSRRRGIALYGGYYARSLANPDRVEQLPQTTGGPDAAFLRAYAVGFLQDLRAAMTVIHDAERQYPDDPQLPAYRAGLALLLNDRAQYEEAVNRALTLDPNEPTALETRALYRAGFQGDNKGAMADLEAAIQVTPGNATTWNTIGVIQSSRDANREAEAAFEKAIELNPHDPIAYANLAIFYLDTGRMKKAKAAIDKALEVDPAFDLALVARGRYYLERGELDRAIEDLLAGTVANPAYSQGQLMLAAGHYEKGDRIAADQALDNADRLDNNDPVIASVRAALAIDDYDSVSAIRHAQEYLRRSKARGGEFTSVGANHEAGSTLNDAFRLQGLDAWGEYYGDAAFDPFQATAYVDQSIRGSAYPFIDNYFYGDNVITNDSNGQAFSSLLQGLLLDPHIISGPSRRANLLRQPFFEAEIGGGFTTAGGETGYTAEGLIQSYTNIPIPVSLYANLEWQRTPEARDIGVLTDQETENKLLGGNGYLTASPTAYDRLVLYFNDAKSDISQHFTTDSSPIFGPLTTQTTEQEVSSRLTNAGLGWSHTFGYQNVMNAALLYSGIESNDYRLDRLDFAGVPVRTEVTLDEFAQRSYIAGINHMVGAGDLTWRYGVEGGVVRSRTRQFISLAGVPASASTYDDSTVGRIYVDLLHDINDDFTAEYALFGSYVEGDTSDIARIEPRIGFAWSPAENHWLRASLMRSSIDLTTPTLSPIGVVGLQPNAMSVGTEGYVDTYALRWDAEWTPDFFTAFQYQHQDIEDPRISIPLASTPFTTPEGRLDRASLTANAILGHGFGLSSTVAYSDSEDEGDATPTAGGSLPFVPEWAGQVALTWVSQAHVKVTLAANYIGERVSDDGSELDDYWTLDANMVWEPFDDRFELELAAYNLLDEDIELNTNTPGWGRSFKGSLKDSAVVVAIDEPSLAEINLQWPWPRRLHAQLISRLRAAGAKVIGLDIIFSEPSTGEDDLALAKALGPDVVLAADETIVTSDQADQFVRVMPLDAFLQTGALAGIASVGLHGDGVLRQIPDYLDGFAATMATTTGDTVQLPREGSLVRVFGGPRTYPTVSYYQALDPDAFLPPGFFRGKTVVVGLSLQNAPSIRDGGADAFATSDTVHTGRLTAGAEIQATILDNLRHGLSVAQSGGVANQSALLFASLAACLLVWRNTGWLTIAGCLVAIGCILGASFAALEFGRIFLSPAAPILAVAAIAAAQSAMDYAHERRNRRQITRAFSQYLAPALVAELAKDPGKLKLGGEKKCLSVLFCDVRGFTTISERLKDDPQQLTQLINRLLTPLSDIVLSHGGTIDKYIGDCLMAFWNAPLDDPDHAKHAVAAALAMLGSMDKLNSDLQREAEADGREFFPLRIGIGVNTGECVVGNMGSEQRFDYSALGDTVNLAARLEGASKNYEVSLLLGPQTAQAVASDFSVFELDRITVKGKVEETRVFTASASHDPSAALRHQQVLETHYRGELPPRQLIEDLAAAVPELRAFYSRMMAKG